MPKTDVAQGPVDVNVRGRVVGHKTFRDGLGFRHEPLYESEAAAIRSVKAVYPNAFAERCANGGCVIRQSLQRGIVIGYVSPGDHIAAWLDADRRISEGHNT